LAQGGPARDDEGLEDPHQLVHDGIRRSQYGEMAEAIFLTQGFVYPTAEAAEARFQKAGEDEFIYARYGNPTTRMFEDRIAALEGTEDAFATASGMAAVNGALMSCLKAGDHVVSARALFGSCLYILEEVLHAVRGEGHLRRRRRSGPVARAP
jgi:O-succinylhomoserine sulfhydrylase